jgi:uncharacterized protein (TIGR02117 family)
MSNAPQQASAKPRRTVLKRIFRGFVRCCQLLVFLLVSYFLIAFIGLIPVNNDFEPTVGGVEIMVTSSEIHADFVLPIRNETVDWTEHLLPSDFTGNIRGSTHVALGWGNKEFYIETPTWADLKAATVIRALFTPSETCMHVNMWNEQDVPEGSRKTTISQEQYRGLVDYIRGSFRRDADGRFLLIAGRGYGSNDAFYHANGSYHALNTCNCWVGRGLRAAGVRTGWFTPLPNTVTHYMQ